MKDLQLNKIMKYKKPDMSQVKPPTEHAVKKMARNLRAAAKN